MDEKFEQLKQMYNELNDRFISTEEEVLRYRAKRVPRFEAGEKIYCVNTKDKKIVTLKIDEVIIDKFGISYREYINEKEFRQFPELFSFCDKDEANQYVADLETK